MGQDNGKLCVIHACLLLTLYVLFDCILLAIIPYLGNCFSDINNNNLNIWFFCRNICKPDVCPDPTDEKQSVFSSRSLYETPLVHFSCPWVSYVLLHRPPSCRLVRHAIRAFLPFFGLSGSGGGVSLPGLSSAVASFCSRLVFWTVLGLSESI